MCWLGKAPEVEADVCGGYKMGAALKVNLVHTVSNQPVVMSSRSLDTSHMYDVVCSVDSASFTLLLCGGSAQTVDRALCTHVRCEH